MLWKSTWNILEGNNFQLQLVKTWEPQQVPGRKRNVRDCQRIAHLLACGLHAEISGTNARAVNSAHLVRDCACINLLSSTYDSTDYPPSHHLPCRLLLSRQA